MRGAHHRGFPGQPGRGGRGRTGLRGRPRHHRDLRTPPRRLPPVQLHRPGRPLFPTAGVPHRRAAGAGGLPGGGPARRDLARSQDRHLRPRQEQGHELPRHGDLPPGTAQHQHQVRHLARRGRRGRRPRPAAGPAHPSPGGAERVPRGAEDRRTDGHLPGHGPPPPAGGSAPRRAPPGRRSRLRPAGSQGNAALLEGQHGPRLPHQVRLPAPARRRHHHLRQPAHPRPAGPATGRPPGPAWHTACSMPRAA